MLSAHLVQHVQNLYTETDKILIKEKRKPK